MEDQPSQDKSMLWYLHGDERVRMLRYFVREQMDPKLRFTVDYPEKVRIGVVISTYSSIPYLDLNLHYLVNVNHLDVLIHDDCSPDRDALIALCLKYSPHVQLYVTRKRMWHKSHIGALGDTHSFLVGLDWAKKNNFDILVKLSRRLVCTSEFASGLAKLAKESEAFTFGCYCNKDDFPIRTECMAMSVKAWTVPFQMERLALVLKNEYPIYAEFWFHDMARILAYNNGSAKYRAFIEKQNLGPLYDGYALWRDLLGVTRYTPTPRALWHLANSEADYLAASRKVFGERYKLEDFKRIEEF